MLKNKNILLFMFVLFGSSFVQADWRDTLRWLQNNAKQHVTAKKVVAVVGVAALCAVGVGCWWKLRQPADISCYSLLKPKPVNITKFAWHRNKNKEDGFCELSKSMANVYFMAYCSNKGEGQFNALRNALLCNDFIKVIDENESMEKSADMIKDFFQSMNNVVRLNVSNKSCSDCQIGFDVKLDFDVSDLVSVGIVLLDKQKRTVHGATMGDMEIYEASSSKPFVPNARSFLGQKDVLSWDDISIRTLQLPNLSGRRTFIIARKPRGSSQNPKGFPSETFNFVTLSSPESKVLEELVADKDVSLAMEISY